MMRWAFLAGAVLVEILGTISLRMAIRGRNAWYVGTVVGYVVSFVFLTLALEEGLALGVAYGIWGASGVALTAIASRVLFKEPLTPVMMAGIALIASGVLVVELGATH
jgi:small multidrug resistance pump